MPEPVKHGDSSWAGPAPTWVALVIACGLTACQVPLPVDPCQDNADCPGGFTCDRVAHLCLPIPLDAGPGEASVDAAITDTSSDVVGDDVATRDTAGPSTDAAQDDAAVGADSAQPDTAMPDSSLPDSAAPDTSTPDAAAADTTASDTSAPDTTAADTTAPDTTAPDTTAPDTSAPDTSAPDTTAPDTAQPDTAPPCTGPDEDGDGYPNDCDNCPTWDNPGQEDVLEEEVGLVPDGVGDVCDPRPDREGDSVHFIEFFDGALDNTWQEDETGWFTSGGQLLYQGGEAASYLERNISNVGDMVMRAHVTMTLAGSNPRDMVLTALPASGVRVGCAMEDTQNRDKLEINSYTVEGWRGTNYASKDLQGGGVREGVTYRLELALIGVKANCAERDGFQDEVSYTRGENASVSAIGLRTNHGEYAFDWVIVYQLGPP